MLWNTSFTATSGKFCTCYFLPEKPDSYNTFQTTELRPHPFHLSVPFQREN